MRDCPACGSPGGADTTHTCPALARPCAFCGASGGADYTHVCPAIAPRCRLCGQPDPWTGHACPALRVSTTGDTGGWTLDQVESWRSGTWTKEKVAALELRADQHIDDCDACQTSLKVDPAQTPEGSPYYCPVGESLSEEASQAELEFSWQPDFEV